MLSGSPGKISDFNQPLFILRLFLEPFDSRKAVFTTHTQDCFTLVNAVVIIEVLIILFLFSLAFFLLIVFFFRIEFVIIISQFFIFISSRVIELALGSQLNSRRRNILSVLVIIASKLIKSLFVEVVAFWIEIIT